MYTKATQGILDDLGTGITYTWDVKEKVMGLQREAVARRLIEIYELPITDQEWIDKMQDCIETLMLNCKLMPGNCAKESISNFRFFSLFLFLFMAHPNTT